MKWYPSTVTMLKRLPRFFFSFLLRFHSSPVCQNKSSVNANYVMSCGNLSPRKCCCCCCCCSKCMTPPKVNQLATKRVPIT